jgi:hypothetical protein
MSWVYEEEWIIAGVKHVRSWDNWGIVYIDGMLVDQYLDTASLEELSFFAKEGLRIQIEEPEYFEELKERFEM